MRQVCEDLGVSSVGAARRSVKGFVYGAHSRLRSHRIDCAGSNKELRPIY